MESQNRHSGKNKSCCSKIWPASFLEAGLVLLLALIATTGLWLTQENRLPLVANPTFYKLEMAAPLVSVDQAIELYDEGNYLFVDTRGGDAELNIEVPSSFIIRLASFEDDMLALFGEIAPEDPLLLYGDGQLSVVNTVAEKLISRGYTDILILQGGINAWQSGGGETSVRKKLTEAE